MNLSIAISIFIFFTFIHARDVGPWNLRGYVNFPRLQTKRLNPLQLEIAFEYDQINIPYMSPVEVICVGYERNHSACEKGIGWERNLTFPIWSANATKVVKPYNKIIFDTDKHIDLYICQARIGILEPSGQIDWANWTDPIHIQLPNCSLIDPLPSLLTSRGMDNPITAWSDRYMVVALDVTPSNGPNETVEAWFPQQWYLSYNGFGGQDVGYRPYCYDWIGHWQYKITDSRICITMIDMLVSNQQIIHGLPQIPVYCTDHIPIDDILCYPISNLTYITMRDHNSSTDWSVMEYDGNTKQTRTIVGSNSTLRNCDRSLAHTRLIFDWRRYWIIGKYREDHARIIFVSDDSLWSYSIQDEYCERMFPLSDVGVHNISRMSRYTMDWHIFYWIDSDSMLIKAYSFDRMNTTDLIAVQVYNVEQRAMERQVNRRVTENLTFAMDMATYSRPDRPLPYIKRCLIPEITIEIRMNYKSATSASVSLNKKWNMSTEYCRRVANPPTQLSLNCQPLKPGIPDCQFLEYSRRTRNNGYSVDVQGLVEGEWYIITVNASLLDIFDMYMLTNKTFKAETPDFAAKVAISVAAILFSFLIILGIVFWRIYEKNRNLIHIKFEELDIFEKIGKGSFGSVYLGLWSKNEKARWFWSPWRRRRARTDSDVKFESVAAKTLEENHRSAVSFVDELRMLIEIKEHANIIRAMGVCDNFLPFPADEKGQIPTESSNAAVSYENGRDATPERTQALILEYMNMGNCIDYINYVRKCGGQITNAHLLNILQQVVEAFLHLTKDNIVHRDLAARNVLVHLQITLNNNGVKLKKLIVKLADFGLAKRASPDKNGVWIYRGTRNEKFAFRSAAPEAFKRIFSSKTDVWAFGIFIWELYMLITHERPTPYADIYGQSIGTDGQSMGDGSRASSSGRGSQFSQGTSTSIDSPNISTSIRSTSKPIQQNGSAIIMHDLMGIPEEAQFANQDSNNTCEDITRDKAFLIQPNPSHASERTAVSDEDRTIWSEMDRQQKMIKLRLDQGKTNVDFVPLPKPEAMPESIFELMKSCWAYEPEARLTFDQIMHKLKILIKEDSNGLGRNTPLLFSDGQSEGQDQTEDGPSTSSTVLSYPSDQSIIHIQPIKMSRLKHGGSTTPGTTITTCGDSDL